MLASYALLLNCLGDQCHIYYLLCALQYTTVNLEVSKYSLEQYIGFVVSLTTKPMYCSREYFKTSRLIQQYEKSTPNNC